MDIGQNIVTFGAATIDLESPLRLRGGLRPDVWRAKLPYTEFAKISGSLGAPQVLTFNHTGAVDVTIANVTIVDIEAIRYGTPQGGTPQIVEYRLYLSDFRYGLVSPRGGRLKLGLVNASPQATDPNADDDSDPEGGDDAPIPISQLMQLCLAAMGMPGTSIDGGVDNVDPPMDLKWFGSHAPSELEKLLKKSGAVFCPHLDGSASIEMPGVGAVPALPNPLPPLNLGAIDRRGKTLVVSSYPNPIFNTASLSGPSNSTFQFVATGDGTNWVTLDQLGQFGVPDPVAGAQNNFDGANADARELIRQTAYHCVQICTPAYDPQMTPVLSRVINNDLSQSTLQLTATIAVQGNNGLWQDQQGVTIPAVQIFPDSGVIMFGAILGTVGNDNQMAIASSSATFSPCSTASLTFATEATTTDGSGNVAHAYYERGFQIGPGGVGALNDGDTANALQQSDTVVYCDASLQGIQTNGALQNQSDLDSRAQAIAANYLAGSATAIVPQQLATVGFFGCNVSGAVQEVSIDQHQVLTTLRVNTWHRPTGSYSADEWARLETAEAHPGESQTVSRKTSLGASGYTQPISPLGPPVIPDDDLGIELHATSAASGGGLYTGFQLGGGSMDPASDLNMPEGATAGTTSWLIANLAENNRATHRFDAGAYLVGRKIGTTANGQPVAIVDSCQCNPSAAQVWIGNVNASQGQAPDATYETADDTAVEDADAKIVQYTVLTRIAFNPSASTPTFYAFYRIITLTCGVVSNISKEIQSTIFTTASCT